MFLIMDNYLMDFCVASLNRVYLFCLWYRKLRWFYPGVRLLPLPCVCVCFISTLMRCMIVRLYVCKHVLGFGVISSKMFLLCRLLSALVFIAMIELFVLARCKKILSLAYTYLNGIGKGI